MLTTLSRYKFFWWLTGLLWGTALCAQPEGFVENKGQWSGNFDFKLQLGHHKVFIRADELALQLFEPPQSHAVENGHHPPAYFNTAAKGHTYKIQLLGANSNARLVTDEPLPGYFNYLKGRNQSHWQTRVHRYREITYIDIYPKIDLRYQLTQYGAYKYEFVIRPGGDPSQIQMAYRGQDTLGLLEDRLIVETTVENVVESAPFTFQEKGGKQREISCQYRLNENILSFKLADYDKDLPLVIDPVLIFSTYTGSAQDNWGFTATPGVDGTAYAGGIVFGPAGSSGYPTSTGAFQISKKGGPTDAVISKFSADGSQLVYSTYLGGSSSEAPISLLEVSDKRLAILGFTSSPDFPVSLNANDTSFHVGPPTFLDRPGYIPALNGVDVFITILDSTGGAISASTLLGDSLEDGKNGNLNFNRGDEFRGDLAYDDQGNLIVATNTLNGNLTTTAVSAQPTAGGNQDGYIVSYNSDLSAINWATYLGGAGDDAILSLSLTDNQRLYATGATNSQSIPNTPTDAFQSVSNGLVEGLVAELNLSTGALENFTYTGTADNDLCYFTDVDPEGKVVVFGQSYGNFPLIGDSLYVDSGSAQFLQRFNADLTLSDRATVFGSGRNDGVNISPTALLVDQCGNLYISGFTPANNTNDLGTTLIGKGHKMPLVNPYQPNTDSLDFYFLVMDASWQRINYATYFGGAGTYDHVDGGTSRFSKEGAIYQAVCAGCGSFGTFPTTAGAYSETNGANNCNLAVLKFDFEAQSIRAEVNIFPGQADTVCVGDTIPIVNNSYNADLIQQYKDEVRIGNLTDSFLVVNEAGRAQYKFIAIDTTCNLRDSSVIDIFGIEANVQADFQMKLDSCEIPQRVSFLNNSTGDADQYTWFFGDGDSSSQEEPSHIYSQSGTYEVILVGENQFCGVRDTLAKTISVNALSNIAHLEIQNDPCSVDAPAYLVVQSSGYQNYRWRINGQPIAQNSDTIEFTFNENKTYNIAVELEDTLCKRSQTLEEVYMGYNGDQHIQFPNVFTPNGDGLNDFFGPIRQPSEQYLESYNLKIYDRRGKLIFEGFGADAVWDGQFENAKMDEAVYFYILNYQDICGQQINNRGFTHLMR